MGVGIRRITIRMETVTMMQLMPSLTIPNEWVDNDKDGVGNNADQFDDNPYEWKDSDGDGVGDNLDPEPTTASIWPDEDFDLLPNEIETTGCTSELDADTDDDGLLDGDEDSNLNGTVDPGETNPCNADTDGDGLFDGLELGVNVTISDDTNPTIFEADTDTTTRTNPLKQDTDDDGVLDGIEDANHNGAVDDGETDPLVSETSPSSQIVSIVYSYHTDYMGTPLAITNFNGTKVWSAEYLPFGEIYSVDSTIQNFKRFVGNEQDEETLLGNFRARYLEYSIGRFLAVDPVRAVNINDSTVNFNILHTNQRLNLYSYSQNNPIARSDKDGLFDYIVHYRSASFTPIGLGISFINGTIVATTKNKNKTYDSIDFQGTLGAISIGLPFSVSENNIVRMTDNRDIGSPDVALIAGKAEIGAIGSIIIGEEIMKPSSRTNMGKLVESSNSTY